jgi:hypothetical protein
LNPTLSVVVRTVRRPQRLRDCLQSLAAQNFRNFELVLVDMSGGLASTIVEEMRACLPALRNLKLNGATSRSPALNRWIDTLSRHAGKGIPSRNDSGHDAQSH